jgi:hypothetical protein
MEGLHLLKAASIQSNNLWLRFGVVIVAVSFAGGTYVVYRSTHRVYEAVTGIVDEGWTLNVLVCTIKCAFAFHKRRIAALGCKITRSDALVSQPMTGRSDHGSSGENCVFSDPALCLTMRATCRQEAPCWDSSLMQHTVTSA